jgi:hypothetical protein
MQQIIHRIFIDIKPTKPCSFDFLNTTIIIVYWQPWVFSGVQYFVTVIHCGLKQDVHWSSRATKEIMQHWSGRNQI